MAGGLQGHPPWFEATSSTTTTNYLSRTVQHQAVEEQPLFSQREVYAEMMPLTQWQRYSYGAQ